MSIRGVIHMHSTYSYDGKVSLADLKKLLVAEGISFCCMSEHTDELTPEAAAAFVRECQELSDESFLFVPGFEVPYQDAHVLHFGCSEFLGQFANNADELKAWRAVARVVVLAHPVRNKFKLDEHLEAVIDGVEVWNQQYEGKGAPRFRALALFTELLAKNQALVATSGLDFHRREHFGTPQLELDLETISADGILASLKAGNFVSVGGQVKLDGKGVFVTGGGLLTKCKSRLAIGVIDVGKLTNKILASLGVTLPKSLRQFIRRRV